jgi:hypothetical protein
MNKPGIGLLKKNNIFLTPKMKFSMMKRSMFTILLFISLVIAGCYSSKNITYQAPCFMDETWQVKIVKSGFYPVISVLVNDSVVITKPVPVYDPKGINTTETYRGHEVSLLVTFNNGFVGIGSYYSASVIIDNKFFVGQCKLPTINLKSTDK